MVFLELRRDSRVTTGNSGCLLCWPRQVQSSIRVAKESWGLLSSDCRANRPHLGLCPEANVPLQGRQGSRGCIPDAPGETGIHLEWKQRTPLCSRIATGISWSSLGGLKGVKPPEAFGERSRDWSLGHAGDEGPHLSMTGESRGCSRAAAPVYGLSLLGLIDDGELAGSTLMNEMPFELFQILKDDAVESAALNMQYAICTQYAICRLTAVGESGLETC